MQVNQEQINQDQLQQLDQMAQVLKLMNVTNVYNQTKQNFQQQINALEMELEKEKQNNLLQQNAIGTININQGTINNVYVNNNIELLAEQINHLVLNVNQLKDKIQQSEQEKKSYEEEKEKRETVFEEEQKIQQMKLQEIEKKFHNQLKTSIPQTQGSTNTGDNSIEEQLKILLEIKEELIIKQQEQLKKMDTKVQEFMRVNQNITVEAAKEKWQSSVLSTELVKSQHYLTWLNQEFSQRRYICENSTRSGVMSFDPQNAFTKLLYDLPKKELEKIMCDHLQKNEGRALQTAILQQFNDEIHQKIQDAYIERKMKKIRRYISKDYLEDIEGIENKESSFPLKRGKRIDFINEVKKILGKEMVGIRSKKAAVGIQPTNVATQSENTLDIERTNCFKQDKVWMNYGNFCNTIKEKLLLRFDTEKIPDELWQRKTNKLIKLNEKGAFVLKQVYQKLYPQFASTYWGDFNSAQDALKVVVVRHFARIKP